jgi:hypothetical protein
MPDNSLRRSPKFHKGALVQRVGWVERSNYGLPHTALATLRTKCLEQFVANLNNVANHPDFVGGCPKP